MKGASRRLSSSDLVQALDGASSVSEAARRAGLARTKLYKRARTDPPVAAALERLKGRRPSALRSRVEAASEELEDLSGVRVPTPGPVPEGAGEVERVWHSMIEQQAEIARDSSESPAVRVKAADSALRWATARLSALATARSNASSVGQSEAAPPKKAEKADRPKSSREVAELIKFRREGA